MSVQPVLVGVWLLDMMAHNTVLNAKNERLSSKTQTFI